MPVTDLTDAVDHLQAVPLEDFVAERKRLAKELRAAGDRGAAAELAKLPKPTPPAWALNWFAREQPAAMGAWLDVADALRTESAAPGAGLREAMAAHREATGQLVKAVRDGARPNGRALSAPMLERVRALLQAALTDPEQAELLRAGRIVEGEEDELELPAPKPGAPAGRPEKDDAKAAEAERKRAERRAELERALAAATERLEQARAAAGERAHAAAEAAERLEEARRTLHRSESEAEAADDAADDARAEAETAEREAEALAAQRRKLDDS